MNLLPISSGKCSSFGGPADTGVGLQEGLGLIEVSDLNQWWFRRLFLGTSNYDNSKGLARNLDPMALYCAMRFAYGSDENVQGEILGGFTRDQIRRCAILVAFAGKSAILQPCDWGPALDTGRLIDTSPGALLALGAKTDDIVSVSALI